MASGSGQPGWFKRIACGVLVGGLTFGLLWVVLGERSNKLIEEVWDFFKRA